MFSKSTPRQRAFVIGLIIIGIIFSAFFGMRAVHAYKKFIGHRPPKPGQVETDVELIRGWMPIPFVAKTYRVPEKEIFVALNIPPLGNHNKSIKELNQDFYPDKDGYVMGVVKATILAHQTSLPPITVPTVKPTP